jgi:hypothetical protein
MHAWSSRREAQHFHVLRFQQAGAAYISCKQIKRELLTEFPRSILTARAWSQVPELWVLLRAGLRQHWPSWAVIEWDIPRESPVGSWVKDRPSFEFICCQLGSCCHLHFPLLTTSSFDCPRQISEGLNSRSLPNSLCLLPKTKFKLPEHLHLNISPRTPFLLLCSSSGP